MGINLDTIFRLAGHWRYIALSFVLLLSSLGLSPSQAHAQIEAPLLRAAIESNDSADDDDESQQQDNGSDKVVSFSQLRPEWQQRGEARLVSWLEANVGTNAFWLWYQVGSNALWRFLVAAFSFLTLLLVLRLLLSMLLKRLRKMAASSERFSEVSVDAHAKPLWWLTAFTALYVGAQWLHFEPSTWATISSVFRIISILFVSGGILKGVEIFGVMIDRYAEERKIGMSPGLRGFILRFIKVIIVFVALMLILQEMGYNVGGLMAGLGVGGLAFALAAKDTLANWFGAVMIFTDKPFEVGDWIRAGSIEGTVEDIGLRSTKVRTFSRTVVVVPNSIVALDVIENVSRMPNRRVSYKLGLTYDTTPDQMRQSLEIIRGILREHPGVDQDYWVVRFSDLSEYSLDVTVYYFTVSTAWDTHLEVREEINLKIMSELEKIGVDWALPVRALKFDDDEPKKYPMRTKVKDA